MNRRFLTLALLLSPLANVFTARSLAQASAEYPDVPRGHWAYDAINKLSQAGILEGNPTGHFNGDSPITRYEFGVTLSRCLNVDDVWLPHSRLKYRTLDDLEKAKIFPPSHCADAVQASWAYDAVQFVQRFGIMQGNLQNQFQGDKPMTRYEFAVALSRVLALLMAQRTREPIK